MTLQNMEKNYFRIADDIARKDCTCATCGNPIGKGDGCKRLFIPCYPKGKLIHSEFCAKENKKGFWQVTKNDNNITGNCRGYDFNVIAPIGFASYFLAYGFTYKKINGTYAKFTKKCNNNRTSGHIVSTLLREGFKVFVNDTQVFNHVDFDKVSKYIQLHDYTTELKR